MTKPRGPANTRFKGKASMTSLLRTVFHVHKCMDGFGSMGDSYVCVKCGHESFWEPVFATFLPNDCTFVHFHEYPWVRKFPDVVTWTTDTNDWTHYFDRRGKLRPRSDAFTDPYGNLQLREVVR